MSHSAALDAPDFYTDWAVDWGEYDGNFAMHLTAIEHAVAQPYSALVEITVISNPAGTEKFNALEKVDLDWVERATVIELLCNTAKEQDVKLRFPPGR